MKLGFDFLMDFCCCCWDSREKRERGFLSDDVVVVTDLNEKEETIIWVLI